MMNYPEIVLDIWKNQYETDFALLDTPQEQIEFLETYCSRTRIIS